LSIAKFGYRALWRRATLERAGQPIGGMDLMFAAHALAESGFAAVPDLRKNVLP